MSSYFIALINIHDPGKYEQYLAGFDDIFVHFKGKVIAVEDNARVLEGNWPAGRTVIIKFPNDDELRKWYDSEEYQALSRFRKESSIASIAMITVREQ